VNSIGAPAARAAASRRNVLHEQHNTSRIGRVLQKLLAFQRSRGSGAAARGRRPRPRLRSRDTDFSRGAGCGGDRLRVRIAWRSGQLQHAQVALRVAGDRGAAGARPGNARHKLLRLWAAAAAAVSISAASTAAAAAGPVAGGRRVERAAAVGVIARRLREAVARDGHGHGGVVGDDAVVLRAGRNVAGRRDGQAHEVLLVDVACNM